jgi:toxin-antitoxin system PIN domain toxin
MIVPDLNVLVYAYNADSLRHAAAKLWWEDTLNGQRPIGFAWATLLGFLRVMTQRRILERPMKTADAIRTVSDWLAQPSVQIVTPGDGHARILFDLIGEAGTAGNLTTDAHLAALAIEYQAEIASADTDFARFPGLRWFNPLAAGGSRKTTRSSRPCS